jgi:hypothetical protein
MENVDGRLSQGFGDETRTSQASELKEKLGDTAQQAAEQARLAAERGKQKIADGAQGVTAALRHASEGLRSDEQEELARYTSAVADKLEQLTGMLRNRDLSSMVADATRFAQRQPALFLGGAFTTGLLAARFLKSSGGHRPAADRNRRGETFGTAEGGPDNGRAAEKGAAE